MENDNYMDGKQTRNELLLGIVPFVLLFLAGNLLIQQKLAYTLGLLLGVAVAAFMTFHMYSTLERAMLYDQDTAKKKIKFASMFRMFFMIVALVIAVLMPKYFSVLGVLFGILSLKFSAYLQPLTHKLINKFRNKGR